MWYQIMSRRRFLAGIGAVSGAWALSPLNVVKAFSEPGGCYRSSGKKVRWIVPYSPGGGYDTYSRLIQPLYEKKIGVKIYIDNVKGAGGVVGAKALRKSPPDGLTLGILNASGLLVTALTGQLEAPNPATDFTILGRLTRNRRTWLSGSSSRLHSLDDVFSLSTKRPVVFGISDVGGLSFVDVSITSSLLGIPVEFVSGYPGSYETALAAIRGEVDVIDTSFDAFTHQIEQGDLKPLLQISSEDISPHLSLRGVPLLGGDEGVASQRAKELGRDGDEVRGDVHALISLLDGGRIIAAPQGIEKGLFQCLEERLHEILTSPGFQVSLANAHRFVDVARADETLTILQTASERSKKFIPIVQRAMEKARG